MNDPEELESPTRKRLPRRRRLALLIMLIVLLLLIGFGWWRMPRVYHVVARYSTSDIIMGSSAGFVTSTVTDESISYSLHDWTGNQQWRVTVALLPASVAYPSLSPDGRTFAVAVTGPNACQVYTWHDSIEPWCCRLPFDKNVNEVWRIAWSRYPVPVRVRALDDGNVFVSLQFSERPLYLVQDEHVVARGKLPFEGYISPDGKALASHSGEYAQIRIEKERITILPCQNNLDLGFTEYILSKVPGSKFLCAEGRVMTIRGEVYDHNIVNVEPEVWEHEEITIDGRYTLQWEFDKRQARVFSPVSGKSWRFALPKGEDQGEDLFQGGIASQDGRHALIVSKTTLPLAVISLLKRIPIANDWLYRDLDRLYQAKLIEKPGRTRATINISSLRRQSGDNLLQLLLSPDGRAIVTNSIQGEDITKGKVVLFRW